MSSQKHNRGRFGVNLSQYHAGQIVTPRVFATPLPGNKYRVEWCWFDSSDRTESGHGRITATYADCCAALAAAGIFADDHRF